MQRALKTPHHLLVLMAGSTFVLLTSACFNVEAPQIYRCSAAEPACPPGLICRANLCVNRGAADAASDLAADSTSDAKSEGTTKADAVIDTAPVADLSKDASPAPDLSTDMYPAPDLSTDMSPAPDLVPRRADGRLPPRSGLSTRRLDRHNQG